MPKPKKGKGHSKSKSKNSNQTKKVKVVQVVSALSVKPQIPKSIPVPVTDLDQFLNLPATGPAQSIARNITIQMPEADKLVIVGLFIDDSGSMNHLRNAVIDGAKVSVEAFRGAKGSDFYLDVRGFKRKYFQGFLKDVTDGCLGEYMPDYGETPLITKSINHLQGLRSLAEQYQSMGISVTVALLIISDGFPNNEEVRPKKFAEVIEAGDYIVGMGCAPVGDDESVTAYRYLFESMGITNIMTPKAMASEVRHAINQFSQSVAAIASA